MPSVHIVYASSSGHTQYVVDHLCVYLRGKGISDIEVQIAERATAEDLARGDVLILGSGTWNTGGIEGQLNPHMHELLLRRAKDVDLSGKKATLIALGDERYYYTARAGEHLRHFLHTQGAEIVCDPLTIVNEPYGQEEKIENWGANFVTSMNQ